MHMYTPPTDVNDNNINTYATSFPQWRLPAASGERLAYSVKSPRDLSDLGIFLDNPGE